jgi:hypothetical protein
MADAFPNGHFFVHADRGHVIFRPPGAGSFGGADQVWAVCTTGDGWLERAQKICALLNADVGAKMPKVA